jgi:D-sedoheptulose 7-phosphate isomerase
MMNFMGHIDTYLIALQDVIQKLDKNDIYSVIKCLESVRQSGGRVFIMGNGGSAATASHFVCDFNKNVSGKLDNKYRFISLNDNIPTLMALANDIGYDHVFTEQLKNYLEPGDAVMAISASGNSPNVVNALEYAKDKGCKTLALTGFTGGKLRVLADYSIHVPVNDYGISEDIHMILDHLMAKVLCEVNRKDEK